MMVSNGVLTNVRNTMKNTGHVSNVLRTGAQERVTFDPTNLEHLKAYKTYLKTNKWVLNFYAEGPVASVPQTVERKIVEHALANVELES